MMVGGKIVELRGVASVTCGECGHEKSPSAGPGLMPCPRIRANGEPCSGYIHQHEAKEATRG